MIYFITEDDLLVYANQTDLGVLDQNDASNWQRVSLAVAGEIQSYIGHRYNIDLDLRGLSLSTDGLAIEATSTQRYYQSTTKLHYLCILDTPSAQSLTNITYFTQVDDRNQIVLMRFLDMVLYHLHAHITPQNIPEIRQQRYDGNDPMQRGGAIGWLKMLQKGDVTTVLTVNVDSDGEEEGSGITYGNISKEKYKR